MRLDPGSVVVTSVVGFELVRPPDVDSKRSVAAAVYWKTRTVD